MEQIDDSAAGAAAGTAKVCVGWLGFVFGNLTVNQVLSTCTLVATLVYTIIQIFLAVRGARRKTKARESQSFPTTPGRF